MRDPANPAADADQQPAPDTSPPPHATSARRRHPVRRALVLVLVLALGYLAGVAQPFVFRPPLVLGQDAATDSAGDSATVTLETVGSGRAIVVAPADGRADVLFVLYPGGLVRPQAYEWLARSLAAHGVLTVIPDFAFDLAVVDAGRAASVIERFGPGRRVVVGGHSLGGAMAARFAAGHTDAVAGLVLLASYPEDSLSLRDTPLKAVSLLAEHDQVAASAKVRGGMERLPADAELVVVPGAVHSFFGRYGPQAGDGVPTVPRAVAEAAIVATVLGTLDRVR